MAADRDKQRPGAAPLHVASVLELVLASASRLFLGDGGSVMLLVGDELEVVCAPGNDAALGARVKFGEGVAGKVAATRDPVLVSGRAGERSQPVDSAMSVPLLHDGRIFGVLNINAVAGHTFAEHDLEAATDFGAHAADALAAARLYEVARRDDDEQPVRHLEAMLSHLARAARIDFVERRPGGLVDVVRVAQAVAADRTSKDAPVDVRGPGSLHVIADEAHVHRALSELVDNSRVHGTPPVRIVVERGEGTAVITVADGGPGVPENERERMFEPFARLERSAALPGLGLGLTIARKLIESMGGTVTLGETPVGGTAAQVTLLRG